MSIDDGVNLGTVRVLRTSDKAMLVVLEDHEEREEWIPYGQIHDDSEVYDRYNVDGDLIVSSWFAKKLGLE